MLIHTPGTAFKDYFSVFCLPAILADKIFKIFETSGRKIRESGMRLVDVRCINILLAKVEIMIGWLLAFLSVLVFCAMRVDLVEDSKRGVSL